MTKYASCHYILVYIWFWCDIAYWDSKVHELKCSNIFEKKYLNIIYKILEELIYLKLVFNLNN